MTSPDVTGAHALKRDDRGRSLARAAQYVSHDALDAAFAFIADRADALTLCDGPPGDGVEAATSISRGGRALGAVAMSTGLGHGDYTVASGDVSGRKLTVAAQDAVMVSQTGLATHVALIETAAERLLLVTRLSTPVAVVEGSCVALEEFDDEIQDPI